MTKKLITISLLCSICFSSSVLASGKGLTQSIITKYLQYSFQPNKRDVFTSSGHTQKFKENNIKLLRARVTPMLDKFKQVFDYSIKNNISLKNYDPTINSVVLSEKTLSKLKTLTYPINIKWLSRNDYSKGKEFIEVSFKSVVSSDQFLSVISSYERILGLNLLRKEIKSKKTRRRLTKAEKEMLEPIKLKELSFYKYQDYYGLYYKFSGLVEAAYYSEVKEMLKNDFTNVQQNFKYKFYRSKEVNMAVNAKILLNLQKEVEDQDYEALDGPFKILEVKLPKVFKRITKFTQVSELRFLIAKKPDSDSIVPVFQKIINSI